MADWKKELETALADLGESSRFCVSGSLSPVLPGLEVSGAGAIGIPVTGPEAKRLIEHAAQAPYGRG